MDKTVRFCVLDNFVSTCHDEEKNDFYIEIGQTDNEEMAIGLLFTPEEFQEYIESLNGLLNRAKKK